MILPYTRFLKMSRIILIIRLLVYADTHLYLDCSAYVKLHQGFKYMRYFQVLLCTFSPECGENLMVAHRTKFRFYRESLLLLAYDIKSRIDNSDDDFSNMR